MNEGDIRIDLGGQQLILSTEKALFWVEQRLLVVSDLHLGKAGHFRKHGIPIPSGVHHHDLFRLETLIGQFTPETVLFLGDLFHSDFNDEWLDLLQFRKRHFHVNFLLVQGNHDVMNPDIYPSSGIELVDEHTLPPFHFTHKASESDLYNISGHVHPGIRLSGAARQGISLPCFFFEKDKGIMPAFGNFTGTYKIRPTKGSRVFAVSVDGVIELVF